MMDAMKNVLTISKSAQKRLKKFLHRLRGDVFDNAGAVTEADIAEIHRAIDRVNPTIFIEIGTGTGVSTRATYKYLQDKYPVCDFYTLDIFQEYLERIVSEFQQDQHLHVRHGLSVKRSETTDPAFEELGNYNGPDNVLRKLLDNELNGKSVDIAFIDSRKGTAVPEFKVLAERLSPDGIILCHDLLNGGKGVELVDYLQHDPRFTYQIINTGPAGMIRIQRS